MIIFVCYKLTLEISCLLKLCLISPFLLVRLISCVVHFGLIWRSASISLAASSAAISHMQQLALCTSLLLHCSIKFPTFNCASVLCSVVYIAAQCNMVKKNCFAICFLLQSASSVQRRVCHQECCSHQCILVFLFSATMSVHLCAVHCAVHYVAATLCSAAVFEAVLRCTVLNWTYYCCTADAARVALLLEWAPL